MRRRGLLGVTGAAVAGRAFAQGRPARLIVPFAAGGPADIFGRLFADAFGAALGVPVVIENRAGAGGVVGTEAAAREAPDGLTFGFTGPGALSVAPAMPGTMPFDIWRDLAHLTLVVRVPEVLAVSAAGPHRDVAGLVAAAKAAPGRLNFGSAGVGSLTHLAGALFASEAGVEVQHVPYRGAAPAATDLLAGRIEYLVADVPVLRPHIESGGMRALAVTTARRVPLLPDVPTTAELGLPRVVSDNWYGLAVPASTPAAVQDRLHAAAVAALRSDALVRAFAGQAGEASPLSRADYAAFLRAEADKWAPIVRRAGVTAL